MPKRAYNEFLSEELGPEVVAKILKCTDLYHAECRKEEDEHFLKCEINTLRGRGFSIDQIIAEFKAQEELVL